MDTAFTTPLLAVSTDGEAIIWSSGAAIGRDADYAPDLYHYLPDGEAAPRLVYSSENRRANLIPIRAEAGQFAFAESIPAEGLELTWRLVYMDGPDSDPVVVDEADGSGADAGPLPFFALDETRFIWTAFHAGADGLVSEVRMRDRLTGAISTLLSAPIEEEQFWFVDLDHDRLVFGTVEIADQGREMRKVYILDLAEPDRPERLDSDGEAAMPVLNSDFAVWKRTDPEFHMLNAGQLVGVDLATGDTFRVDLGESGLNHPSIGDRYVTAWQDDATKFMIFDLVSRRPFMVWETDPISDQGVVRPSLSGDLLAYQMAPGGDGELILMWAFLP